MNKAGITSGKIWGQTHKVFDQNNVEIDHIIGKRGYACSLHHHAHKFNTFYAISGVWVIEVHKQYQQNSPAMVDRTVITAGQTARVAHGEVHRFICMRSGHCMEVYHTEIEHDDIVRDSVGQPLTDDELTDLEESLLDATDIPLPTFPKVDAETETASLAAGRIYPPASGVFPFKGPDERKLIAQRLWELQCAFVPDLKEGRREVFDRVVNTALNNRLTSCHNMRAARESLELCLRQAMMIQELQGHSDVTLSQEEFRLFCKVVDENGKFAVQAPVIKKDTSALKGESLITKESMITKEIVANKEFQGIVESRVQNIHDFTPDDMAPLFQQAAAGLVAVKAANKKRLTVQVVKDILYSVVTTASLADYQNLLPVTRPLGHADGMKVIRILNDADRQASGESRAEHALRVEETAEPLNADEVEKVTAISDYANFKEGIARNTKGPSTEEQRHKLAYAVARSVVIAYRGRKGINGVDLENLISHAIDFHGEGQGVALTEEYQRINCLSFISSELDYNDA